MRDTFALIGFGAVLYIVGRICLYFGHIRKDEDPNDPFAILFFIVAGICFVLSPVLQGILYFIEHLHAERIRNVTHAEVYNARQSAQDIAVELAVTKERDRLAAYYEEEIEKRCERVREEDFLYYQDKLYSILDQEKNKPIL